MNEQIRITPIRVINHNQEQLGVIPTHEALAMARENGLDLVEVSPTERPPVCRIMDYGKFKYERKKRQKIAAAGHTIQLKEIRLRPKTDAHDRSIKVNHARAFLAEGHKVQFTMLFRGRERVHKEMATEAFNQIVADLGETGRLERPPLMEGRRMTMIMCAGKASPSDRKTPVSNNTSFPADMLQKPGFRPGTTAPPPAPPAAASAASQPLAPAAPVREASVASPS
jgi:translation initiation factor IF-3